MPLLSTGLLIWSARWVCGVKHSVFKLETFKVYTQFQPSAPPPTAKHNVHNPLKYDRFSCPGGTPIKLGGSVLPASQNLTLFMTTTNSKPYFFVYDTTLKSKPCALIHDQLQDAMYDKMAKKTILFRDLRFYVAYIKWCQRAFLQVKANI